MRKLLLRLIDNVRQEKPRWRGPVLKWGLAFFVVIPILAFSPSSRVEATTPPSSCPSLLFLVGYVERFSRPTEPFPVALSVGHALIRASRQSGLPLYLLVAVAQEESSFNPGAVNISTQDYGLFQIHYPFWQKFFRRREGRDYRGVRRKDLMEVDVNARMAADILSYDLKLSGGDVVEMLGRYSGRTGAAHESYVRHILRYSLEFKHYEGRGAEACPGP